MKLRKLVSLTTVCTHFPKSDANVVRFGSASTRPGSFCSNYRHQDSLQRILPLTFNKRSVPYISPPPSLYIRKLLIDPSQLQSPLLSQSLHLKSRLTSRHVRPNPIFWTNSKLVAVEGLTNLRQLSLAYATCLCSPGQFHHFEKWAWHTLFSCNVRQGDHHGT